MNMETLKLGLDQRSSRAYKGGVHVIFFFAVAAFGIPLFFDGGSLFTWTTVAVWGLFALSTNVLFGWTGLLSFGQAGFFGIGAYTLALAHQQYPGLSGPTLLIAGAAVAAAVGALFAMFALRTSGAVFAIMTLVLAQVLWLLTFRIPWLKGEDGFSGLFDIEVFGSVLTSDSQLWYYVIAVVAICTWLLWLLHGSTVGMAMRAVRDDPWRAAALGIDVRRIQVGAFSVGAAFSAVAGGLLAQGQGVVSPPLLGFALSGEVLVACLVGGMRVFGGPLLGAALLIWAQTILSSATHESALFVGLILLVIVVALPLGLASIPGRISGATRGRRGLRLASTHRDSGNPSEPPDDSLAHSASTKREEIR